MVASSSPVVMSSSPSSLSSSETRAAGAFCVFFNLQQDGGPYAELALNSAAVVGVRLRKVCYTILDHNSEYNCVLMQRCPYMSSHLHMRYRVVSCGLYRCSCV